MQFMLLICYDEDILRRATPSQHADIARGYEEFSKMLERRGVLRAAHTLHSSSAAKTVRVRDGRQQIAEGPHSEAREQLGGYYLVEVADVAEAVELALALPAVTFGSVEVRPVVGGDAGPKVMKFDDVTVRIDRKP